MKKTKRYKIHVTKGDFVQVITGDEKGKVGKVVKVLPRVSKVIVENINIKIKHIKPNDKVDTGKIIKLEKPIHSSNVMLHSQETQTASRYGYQITNSTNTKNSKQRFFKKTKEIIT
uniref:Large ribosomal subunit protein uL24c n=1 Tax=Hildenbrandia rivularis TaxID=135206 RepID=A0A1C9CFS1_9FLOR|nr:ribosomal protein L24 [Hildenbrandia rivularis]AOM67233.1 ribosomal protein L24 [Hildenbrandia rivularis]